MTREKENLSPNAIFETIETPKKPPRQKIFQEDQMKPLKKLDEIKYLDDINKEKNEKFGCMNSKSIEKRASSALQVGVK